MLKKSRVAFVAPVLLLASYAQSAVSQTPQPPGLDKRLTMYSKPAVVRVVTACFGQYSVSTEQSKSGGQSKDKSLIFNHEKGKDQLENYFTVGTGYFVNPNGYIVTSSDLVKMKPETNDKPKCKEYLAEKLISANKSILNENDKNALADGKTITVGLSTYQIRDEDVQFFRGIILPNGERIPYSFPPGSQSQSGKDITVIKVEVKRAPTLKIGNSDSVQIQDQVLVLGYPLDADQFDIRAITEKRETDNSSSDNLVKALQEVYNPKKLDLTVSKREISSPPRTLQTKASILQIDGRVGIGSVGSPVLNEKGEVVGIVSPNAYNEGYTYATPSNAVNEFTVHNEEGETDRLYRSGLDLFWQGDYRRAFAQFQQVKALFPQHPEIDELITQSQTKMAEASDQNDRSPSVPWLPIAVGAGIGVAAIAGLTAFLLGRRRPQPAPVPPVSSPPSGERRKRGQAVPNGNNVHPTTVFNAKPLIKLNYQGKELTFELDDDTCNLGRNPDWSDFKIPNEWEVFSGRHAVFQKEGDDYRIYDGDRQKPSTNGTFVNDSRIDTSEGRLLFNGNQLRIGRPQDRVLLTYLNPAKNQSNYNPTTVSQE